MWQGDQIILFLKVFDMLLEALFKDWNFAFEIDPIGIMNPQSDGIHNSKSFEIG
jgi:hypothetical protein